MEKIEKIKEAFVLVTWKEDGKEKSVLCETMEEAKRLYPSDYTKKYITLVRRI